MVLDVTVTTDGRENGTADNSETKSIVFSDDCIVAYSVENPFDIECDLLDYWLWTATSMRELRMAVGEENYWLIAEEFRNNWNQTTPEVCNDDNE